MKKALQVFGIIFLLALIAVGSLIGYAAYTGRQLDSSSQKYVDAAVPAIVSNWSESELKARAAPQLLQASSPEQLTKIFSWLSSLGPMNKYCGSKGESNTFISPQQGKVVSARYVACAQFEKGEAMINVTLLQQENKSWLIAGFNVNSPALLPQ